MKIILSFLAGIFLCAFAWDSPASSQALYVDPSIIALTGAGPELFENSEPVLLGVSADEWAVTCTAEPLLQISGSAQIAPNSIYIKHDLTDDFLPLTTSLDLGSGSAPTIPYTAIINRLFFQVRLTGAEPAGSYAGQIHFYNFGMEAALLTISLTIERKALLTVEPASFSFFCSSPGLYSSEGDGLVTIAESNSSDWHVQASLLHSSAPSHFNGANIFIRSALSEITDNWGAGEGFQPLEQLPVLISGEQVGQAGSTAFYLRLLSSWDIPAGHYDVTIEFFIPEVNARQQIALQIDITQYAIFSLSESSIYFHADGPPSIWDADKTVKLTVGCNSSEWGAYCEATPLTSPADQIPNERLYLKINPGDFLQDAGAGIGYQSMNQIIEVAGGSAAAPREVSEMWFRLKTMDVDLPGHYEGTITFSLFTNP